MTFVAKCIRCRSNFDQIFSNTRYCQSCKIISKKETTNAKNLKLSILRKSRIVQCKYCKKDTSGYYGKIYCPPCKIISKKLTSDAKNLKRHLYKKSRIVQCKYCKKDTGGYHQKSYCSSLCKYSYWNIPKNIKRTQEKIILMNSKIEKWKSLIYEQ